MKKFKEIKEARDMGDYLGMDKKQKMKFDELMKKLKGGKEHMKFRRMAKTPVQGDDMFHGYVKDLATGAIKETVQVQEAIPFSDAQLSKMKKSYATLKTIDPSSQNYKKLKTAIRKLDVDRLEQIARAKIRFVSTIAAGEYAIKSGKRLHARDYLESTELEEKAITLGGTNKTGGDIFMGDKGIQKMIALSKKNPNIEYTVKSDNYGDFKAHWLKNGKFALRTVANINFDMDKNAVRGVPKGKTVKSTIFILRYSVNEGVQMEAMKTTHVVIDTANNNKVVATTSDEEEAKSSIHFAELPPMSIKNKKTLKVVKLKKPAGQRASDMMLGYPLKEELDNEGGMALQQLKVAKDAAMELCDIIKKDDNLPEWVQSKLTKAVDYMDSVRDYMSSKDADEYVTEINDARKAELKRQEKAKVKKQKLDLVSKQKKQAIDRIKSQKRTAKMGGDIAKDSEEMKRLNKTYADKVQKIMQEENVDESMARARADARRHMGGRGAQRGMAPLKKDSDISASDADRKAANKNIIMQIRKAADLPNGAEVEFPSGKKKLDRNTAQQLLTKFGSLRRSSEKDAFQKSIRSLSDIKKLIGR